MRRRFFSSAELLSLTLLTMSACATTATRDDATRRAVKDAGAPPNVATAVKSDASVVAADAAPSESSKDVSAFYAVAEGACPAARPYAVGTTTALVMNRDAWLMKADAAKPLYQMGPVRYDMLSGSYMTLDHIGDVGGVDEAHAWVQIRQFAGRGEDSSAVFMRTAAAAGANAEWKPLPTPRGQIGFYGHMHVIPQPDGGVWVFGFHSMYLDVPGDNLKKPDADHNRYFAFSSTGEEQKINLPGPDMQSAQRLPTGELVAAGLTQLSKPLLRRWSPVKKVNDIALPSGPNASSATLGIGTTRVVLATTNKNAFYNYKDDKLEASALNARIKDVASWVLTASDDLMVTMADGTLLIEAKDGTVTDEKVPEPGRLASESSAPWFMATSGVVYARAAGKEWRRLTLPNGEWTAETHPVSRPEWVKTIGSETWVSVVRTDVGFGLKKASEIRTLYSSVQHTPSTVPGKSNVLRCGSPYPSGILGAYPPAMNASCATPVVVIASELQKDEKPSYPKIGAALKGNAALGETLSFVGFGGVTGGTNRLLGIAAPTPEIAKELMTKLAKVAPQGPELVCGSPDEHRRITFRVKSGEFAAP